jgi:hypothetical protein
MIFGADVRVALLRREPASLEKPKEESYMNALIRKVAGSVTLRAGT